MWAWLEAAGHWGDTFKVYILLVSRPFLSNIFFFFCFLSVCQMGAVLCYHALSAMMLCLTMADSQNCGLKPMKL